MNRGFLILLFTLIVGAYCVSTVFGKNIDDDLCYTNFIRKELLRDLSFSENQIFGKIYNKENITERLERLELEVFGAIQEGSEEFRIKRMKKSVTNVASGGNGLNNMSKILNLGENIVGNTSYVIGNMHNLYPYSNTYPSYSPRGYSHRLPPPPPYSYNHNPVIRGDFTKNYSIGTGIKILED